LEWDAQKLNAWMRDQLGVTRFRLKHISPLQSQQLTHQKIQGQFFQVELRRLPQQLEHYDRVTGKQIARLAFPRFINQFLEGMPALEKPAPAAHESVRKSKPRSH
jgi:A/G-specific adenine glycosylase